MYLQSTFYLAQTLPEKLDEVIYAEELAEYNKVEEKHPELYELEEKLRKEIKEAGLRPLIHKKRHIIKNNGMYDDKIQELNKDGELVWTVITSATREVNIQKLEEYKKFFKEHDFTDEEIDRYVYRKHLRKKSDLEELQEEKLRLKLAQEGSVKAYDSDTVVDIRDREDYLRKGLMGLDDVYNLDDFYITGDINGVVNEETSIKQQDLAEFQVVNERGKENGIKS